MFLDELDTIGKARAGGCGAGFGAHDEREQTLNQLLVEMDGFDSSKGVIIMAATNRARRARPGAGAARAASTARWSWTVPTSRAARRS